MGRWFIFMGLLIVLIGITLFHVKYKVVGLEQELAFTNKKIIESRQSIHILKAEWEHLNNPQRLQHLAQKHLNLIPFDQTHYIVLSQIPFREDPIVSLVQNTLKNDGLLEGEHLQKKGRPKEFLTPSKSDLKRMD